MALVALSLVLASFIYLVFRPPVWLKSQPLITDKSLPDDNNEDDDNDNDNDNDDSNSESSSSTTTTITAPRISSPTPSTPSIILSPPTNTMPPPPRPTRPPTLSPFPTRNTPPPPPQRALRLGSTTTTTMSTKTTTQRKKVQLEAGFSPLDWARVSGSGADLRGLPPEIPLLRVSPSMLRAHTGRDGADAWTVIQGKVYNITPYARFHPGGVPELMRGAARDATALFRQVHPWVNYESMLAACFVGLLVNEPRTAAEKDLEAMD